MHEIFISHSKDNDICERIYTYLDSKDIKCFMDVKDLIPGISYASQLTDAILNSKVVVLVFSSNSDASGPVQNEVSLAKSNKILVIPVRIEDIFPRGLALFITATQWLDVFPPPVEKHLPKLVKAIEEQIKIKQNTVNVKQNQAISDQNWHDIDYTDLNPWVKERARVLDTGKIIYAKTFIYRRNKDTGKIQKKLRQSSDNVHIGDYIKDHEWHPIDFKDLKDWVKKKRIN